MCAEGRKLIRATKKAAAAASAAFIAAIAPANTRETVSLPYYEASDTVNPPFFARFESFMDDSKEHTMRANKLMWHATGGEEVTVRQLYEILTDDEHRSGWYVSRLRCVQALGLTY